MEDLGKWRACRNGKPGEMEETYGNHGPGETDDMWNAGSGEIVDLAKWRT
jgi:hypothetical protein